MNVEFFFHGVTDAFHEWGTTTDSMQNHYNKSGVNEPVRFAIEIGKIQQQYCVYYSYLRYDLVDSTARPGAYFGFTIRFDDVYCKDVFKLYNICEELYNGQICNNIIQQQGNISKYLIKNFEEKKTLLENINRLAAVKIENLSFASIAPDWIQGNKANTPTSFFNVKEVESPYFWLKFIEAGKIVVSPYFPLKDKTISDLNGQVQPEKEKSQRLSVENEKLKSDLKNTTTQFQQFEKKSTEAQLAASQTINSQKERLEKLEIELKNKDNELMQRKQSEAVSQLVSTVKKPIEDLALYFQVNGESGNHQHSHKQSFALPRRQMRPIYLTTLLSVIILCICCFMMVGNPIKGAKKQDAQELQKTKKELADEKNKNSQLTDSIKELERQKDQLEKEKNELTEKVNKQGGGKKNTPAKPKNAVTSPKNNLTDGDKKNEPKTQPVQAPPINFKLELKPTADSLEKGKTYTVSVIGYNGDVEEWRFDNCTGDKNSKTLENTITVSSNDDDVVVTFVPKGMSKDDARKKSLKKPVKRTKTNE